MSINGKTQTPTEPQTLAETQPKAAQVEDIPAKKSSAKSKVLAGIGLTVLVVGSVVGYRWWNFLQNYTTTENAQVQGHISPVSSKITATIETVLVNNGDAVTVGQPLIRLTDPDLALKVQQAVASLAVAKAQVQVAAAGIPLSRDTNQAQLQQSQANLQASEMTVTATQAQVDQAQASVRTAQARVNQSAAAVRTAQARVAQSQAKLDQAQADEKRLVELFQQGAISAQQRDVVRTTLTSAQADLLATQATVAQAQADLLAAREQVAQAQAQVSNLQAQVQRSQAQVQTAVGQVAQTQASGQQVGIQQQQTQLALAQVRQAEAALALAQQQLAYTVITAPVTGTIGMLRAQVGQKVQPNQALLSVVPLGSDRIYIDANFKETDLRNLHKGGSAEIEADAFPGRVFKAKVMGIYPATGASFALLPPDNATGNFNKVVQWVPVRLQLEPNEDPDQLLRVGLSVHVTVATKS